MMSKNSSKSSSRPKEDDRKEEIQRPEHLKKKGFKVGVGDTVEIRSQLWPEPYVAEVTGINIDTKKLKVEWYYRPEHILMDGRAQLVYDKNVKPEEAITEFLEDEILYAGHSEPEEVSLEYVLQKCNITFVDISEREEIEASSVANDIKIYYVPLHLAYDCNRHIVRRVNVSK